MPPRPLVLVAIAARYAEGVNSSSPGLVRDSEPTLGNDLNAANSERVEANVDRSLSNLGAAIAILMQSVEWPKVRSHTSPAQRAGCRTKMCTRTNGPTQGLNLRRSFSLRWRVRLRRASSFILQPFFR